MINPIYSYTRAARELVSIRSGISHAKRASREKQAAAPNNRRTYERKINQTGIPSWRREEGRSTGKRCEVSTGTHPGDATGTPSFPNHGPEVHRDRIPRHSKPGFQRSFSRLCLELDPIWTCSTRCGSSIVLWQNGYAGACKTSYPGSTPGNTSNHMLPVSSSKPQAASYKDSSFKRQASSVLHKASSFKPQATSCRMQEPS